MLPSKWWKEHKKENWRVISLKVSNMTIELKETVEGSGKFDRVYDKPVKFVGIDELIMDKIKDE